MRDSSPTPKMQNIEVSMKAGKYRSQLEAGYDLDQPYKNSRRVAQSIQDLASSKHREETHQ